MFAVKILSLSLIQNLVAVVLVVFVLTLAIKYLNERKKKNMDSELSSKVDSYLKQHASNTEVESVEKEDYKIAGNPELHILRVVELDNIISIYFSNNGSNIINVDINSPDVPDISIEPQNNIPTKSTGCIKFSSDGIVNNKITFLLNYSDERMNKASIKYLFSISDKEIKEIY